MYNFTKITLDVISIYLLYIYMNMDQNGHIYLSIPTSPQDSPSPKLFLYSFLSFSPHSFVVLINLFFLSCFSPPHVFLLRHFHMSSPPSQHQYLFFPKRVEKWTDWEICLFIWVKKKKKLVLLGFI